MFREIGEERTFNGILKQIIENIQKGTLKAGAALPAERVMAEAMGVSRSAVREVLRALELLGIVESVPGGGNYITSDLDNWLIGPLSILFQLNNSYPIQNQQLRAALERECAVLAAKKCTPLDAAELLIILTRLDGSEDEKTRGDLDKELHHKIAKIADNPMLYSVLSAADQLIESSIFGTRDYIMLKNQSVKDYRRATGFEALIGYLYLSGEYARLIELVEIGLDSMRQKQGSITGGEDAGK